MAGRIILEKNGITLDFFPAEVSADRITAIQVLPETPHGWAHINFTDLQRNDIIFNDVQEAYWSIASTLSEADGIDYSDPEEVWIKESVFLKSVEPLI